MKTTIVLADHLHHTMLLGWQPLSSGDYLVNCKVKVAWSKLPGFLLKIRMLATQQVAGLQSYPPAYSCAGTNFMTRAVAFEAAGWSPTYTLTEDYALGMEMRAQGWHCRYVEEYLAMGEAPDQVRNCFQQRSRWAKV